MAKFEPALRHRSHSIRWAIFTPSDPQPVPFVDPKGRMLIFCNAEFAEQQLVRVQKQNPNAIVVGISAGRWDAMRTSHKHAIVTTERQVTQAIRHKAKKSAVAAASE
jgi:predicted RNA-binding protein YlxR (DUF448 family)